eukprot:PRCOL_00002637-RA
MSAESAQKWLAAQAVATGEGASAPVSPAPGGAGASAARRRAGVGETPPRPLDPDFARVAEGGAGGYSPHMTASEAFATAAASRRGGNERLYEAYNDLHGLAHDFKKPFDAPAILVVGHQTDGKSALVEALMGFQFNHVGGGTKTRRPITLHMQYNGMCENPQCFLVNDDGVEAEHTLDELREYIEEENQRLEGEATPFWEKEIIIKIEYKYCPNLTIIDTPGLIAAAPGRRNHRMQTQSKLVEQMVMRKMKQKEYIMLCLEDSSDWSNATTRSLVMNVDPDLQRTVIVSTKFDTRIPQFSRSSDIELFMRPPAHMLETTILGGSPFFTSVPSGRVGGTRDCIFRSNEQFREAVAQRELADVALLEKRMSRPLDREERSRVGISQLRHFLEHLLQRRYLESVPSIVPVLEHEHRTADSKLNETLMELGALDAQRLKERGRAFRERFLARLQQVVRGTADVSSETFGETLADEHVRGGVFVGSTERPLRTQKALLDRQVPSAKMRLFGGAQYHRAIGEFRAIVGSMECPMPTSEEIANACGVDDMHDGVNYVRTACVLAVGKARQIFEPFLYELGYRLSHVQRRMLPVVLHMLKRDNAFLSGHDAFLQRVGAAYHNFIDETEIKCRERCMEDLQSTTRFVTWSVHSHSGRGLKNFLAEALGGGQGSAARAAGSGGAGSSGERRASGGRGGRNEAASPTPGSSGASPEEENERLVDLLENVLFNRAPSQSSHEIVTALVREIFRGIRDNFMVRNMLEQQQRGLRAELDRIESLKERFSAIHQQLATGRRGPASPQDAAAAAATAYASSAARSPMKGSVPPSTVGKTPRQPLASVQGVGTNLPSTSTMR